MISGVIPNWLYAMLVRYSTVFRRLFSRLRFSCVICSVPSV